MYLIIVPTARLVIARVGRGRTRYEDLQCVLTALKNGR